ncbi:MAG: metal-dependent rane protease [Segetibacter sp.]|nr:metal-dependent rane protease [Segetibacter sp.]
MTAAKPLIPYGWLRALIYVLLMVGIAFIVQLFVLPLVIGTLLGNNAEKMKAEGFYIGYVIVSILFLLVTWLMRKFVDRASFNSLGFTWQGYKFDAWIGFSTAVAIMGIGSLILVFAGYLMFNSIAFDPYNFFTQLIFMLIVATVEEITFRGYLLNNLMQSMNKWVALFISALLFALVHAGNPGANFLPLLNVFIAGVLLGANYIFTKNLWYGIFLHFAWNFMQGPVLGFEVSGLETNPVFQQTLSGPELWTGAPFGFEGSFLCTMLVALAALIITWLFYIKYPAPKRG